MGLRDRIRMLERRSAGEGMLVIIIKGGMPEGEAPTTAEAGERRWTQERNEPRAAFDARVIGSARAAGLKSIIIGGLPER